MEKKDAYYFSHDSNAQDDHKCMELIDQLGMEGYGIFWALIEKLRNEKEYKLPLIVCKSFAKRWGTSEQKVLAVINGFNLFHVENNDFFSLRLMRSMNEKTERARLSASKRWNKDAIALQPHTDSKTNAMRNDAIKVKERKVKKSKIKESKINIPVLDEIKKYFFENGYTEISAVKFFEYYDCADWKDSKGNDVKSWKQKAQAVWFKDENKITPQSKRQISFENDLNSLRINPYRSNHANN